MIVSIDLTPIERTIVAWCEVQTKIEQLVAQIGEDPTRPQEAELDRLHGLADTLICELETLEAELMRRLLADGPGAVGSFYRKIVVPNRSFSPSH